MSVNKNKTDKKNLNNSIQIKNNSDIKYNNKLFLQDYESNNLSNNYNKTLNKVKCLNINNNDINIANQFKKSNIIKETTQDLQYNNLLHPKYKQQLNETNDDTKNLYQDYKDVCNNILEYDNDKSILSIEKTFLDQFR